MTLKLRLGGVGGLVLLIIIGGAVIYTAPQKTQQGIDIVMQRPLVSAGFGVLFVFLLLFDDEGGDADI